jgi:hypothetical protein
MRRALIGLCLACTLSGLLTPLANAQSTGGGKGVWRDHTTYGSVLVSPVADGARTTLYLDLRTRHVALMRYLERLHTPGYVGVRLTPTEVSQRSAMGQSPRLHHAPRSGADPPASAGSRGYG